MTTDWSTPPEDGGIMWEHPIPTPTSVMTVACWLCGKPADLLDPEERFSVVDEVHEACRERNTDEPRDPDWEYEEGLR